MTPQNHPEAVDLLAAEYVLGTLRGAARRRFEAWRTTVPLVQERCSFWENHLPHLMSTLRPLNPPAHVWESVRTRLNLPRGAAPRRPSRVWAVAAGILLAVGLAALLYWRSVEPGPASQTATIATPEGSRLWEVDFYKVSGRMIVHTGRLPAHPTDRDYELWALPAGGRPVSLGVLPASGLTRRALTAAQQQALAASQQVAVTVEPSGGSPTGQPTSTPVYVAPLRAPS